jgi:hypothetical protein
VQPAAVAARVNQIKIMCARNDAPDTIVDALGRLRADMANNHRRRRYVETDGELFSACAYAGVSARR